MLFAVLMACTLSTGDTIDVPATVVAYQGAGVLLEHPAVEGWREAGTHEVAADPNLSRQVAPGDRITARLLLRDDEARLIGVSPR